MGNARDFDSALSDGERALHLLLGESHLAAQHELPHLVATAAGLMGAADAVIYLVDVQQVVLVPFLENAAARISASVAPLGVDSTVAGRAFQNVAVLSQTEASGGARVWLPLVDGTERIGVLAVTLDSAALERLHEGTHGTRLRRFATLVAEVLTAKNAYGDTIARVRRRISMGLAAELQWALLPPLTFATREVTLAGALEPAYQVAGDTLDYAVDEGVARAGVFDGMGHGLRSSQLASVSIAAYRNARRSGLALIDTAYAIHDALLEGFGGEVYTTGVLTELDTTTGLLSWVNAGHPEPLLMRSGRLVKSLRVRPAPPMGIGFPRDTPRPPFVVGHEQLEPGDRVLLYTDGVTEARSPDGEFFGERRLSDLLERNFSAGLPAPETMRRVVRALMAHQEGQLSDDATMLLLEWRSDPAPLLF